MLTVIMPTSAHIYVGTQHTRVLVSMTCLTYVFSTKQRPLNHPPIVRLRFEDRSVKRGGSQVLRQPLQKSTRMRGGGRGDPLGAQGWRLISDCRVKVGGRGWRGRARAPIKVGRSKRSVDASMDSTPMHN